MPRIRDVMGRRRELSPVEGHPTGHNGDRDLESRYQMLVEQIPAIVYVLRMAGGFEAVSEIYVSPQIEGILGFAPEEWEADPMLRVDRLHPEDRDDVVGETARAAEAAEPFTMEYRMVAKDGRVVWLHDEASVLAGGDQGNEIAYQGVQLDITAQKEVESEQRRSLDLLGIIDQHRRQLMARVVMVQEEERRRIAEDLHDDTLQGLFLLQKALADLARDHPEVAKEESLPRLQDELTESVARLRRIALKLHPRILDAEGLRAAFRALFEGSDADAVREYELEFRLEKEPPRETRTILYAIGQEALSNVRKHSGSTRATVSLQERDGGFLMAIEDNGTGFDAATVEDAPRDHVGVGSMSERAELAGGWCRIESSPDSGTRIECWLPGSGIGPGPFLPDEHDLITTSDAAATAVRVPSRRAKPGTPEDLSSREIEVARLLVLGHTNAEIGAILFLSIRTIEHHRANVFRKLGVHARAGLVRWVQDHAFV